jgi:hypothetical protein
MPTTVLKQRGTPLVWGLSGTYVDPSSGNLALTHAMNLTSLAGGEAWQGAKADLQSGGDRPAEYAVLISLEFAPTPAGTLPVVEVWWASSSAATGANTAGTVDGSQAYTGYAGGGLANSILQCEFLGSLIVTADATTVVQRQMIGRFPPGERWGKPIVYSRTAVALHSSAANMFVALIPIEDEIQN